MRRLLIANRGEIAVRIARAAMDLGLTAVAVHSQDDANGLHLRIADEAVPLGGRGVRAYLDLENVVAKAADADCESLARLFASTSQSIARLQLGDVDRDTIQRFQETLLRAVLAEPSA